MFGAWHDCGAVIAIAVMNPVIMMMLMARMLMAKAPTH